MSKAAASAEPEDLPPTPEQCLVELEGLTATVNDDMRTLLREWASWMQKPRAKNWEKAVDDLYVRTRLLLGEFSAAEHRALRAIKDQHQ